tara:strand:+ start:153537 stop:154460 length:924 start_codon:yes stop_codon:yes gene_type:complete
MSKKILIVGTIAYDAIETPFDKVTRILGGSCPYIALAASKFSNDCSIISVIGKDFENKDLEILKKNNINCDGIKKDIQSNTFFWSGKYSHDMNSRTTLETKLNVLDKFNPIIDKINLKPEILIIGNLDPNIQLDVLNQIKSRPKFILLDTMNIWIQNFRNTLEKIIPNVDLLSLNDEEARLLSGENSLFKAADKILEMGIEYLIIKKGEHGCMFFSNNKLFIIPSYPTNKTKDPTGAGDTFAGGIAGFLSNQDIINFETIKQSILYGTILASFTVESFGIKSLLDVTKFDLNKRLNHFKLLTSFYGH